MGFYLPIYHSGLTLHKMRYMSHSSSLTPKKLELLDTFSTHSSLYSTKKLLSPPNKIQFSDISKGRAREMATRASFAL